MLTANPFPASLQPLFLFFVIIITLECASCFISRREFYPLPFNFELKMFVSRSEYSF